MEDKVINNKKNLLMHIEELRKQRDALCFRIKQSEEQATFYYSIVFDEDGIPL